MELTPQQELEWVINAQKWKRIKQCESSLKEFALTYFKHYFYTDFSIMHLELFDTIQTAIENGQVDKIVRAAPRGNAKSTIVSFVSILWCALYRKKHYILLISDTSSQADAFLVGIKSELEDNRLLKADFGNMYGLVWNTSDIVLANDCRIQALGSGKRIRGRKYKQYRPDLIVCDDMENDENVRSVEQRKKTADWFTKALMKAGDERTDFIFVGTVLHPDSLLNNLLKNPIFDSKKYRSVISWSSSPKWDTWEKMITDLSNENRLSDARQYYEDNKTEMLEGTQVLWESKEDYYNLMIQQIADGPSAFSSEKQNEPINDDARRFEESWIQYYEDNDLIGKNLMIVGYIDPSLGKHGGDYSAIIVLGMDTTGQMYILVADVKKRDPDEIISDGVYHYTQWHFSQLGIEANAFQEYFKNNFVKYVQELERQGEKISMSVRGVKVHTDKILRIQSLQPEIKSGRIKFKRDQRLLIEQLLNFPTGDHDDGPDALQGALVMFGKGSSVREFYKEKANEPNRQNIQSFLSNPSLQRLGA